jgi:hypothetical protein
MEYDVGDVDDSILFTVDALYYRVYASPPVSDTMSCFFQRLCSSNKDWISARLPSNITYPIVGFVFDNGAFVLPLVDGTAQAGSIQHLVPLVSAAKRGSKQAPSRPYAVILISHPQT